MKPPLVIIVVSLVSPEAVHEIRIWVKIVYLFGLWKRNGIGLKSSNTVHVTERVTAMNIDASMDRFLLLKLCCVALTVVLLWAMEAGVFACPFLCSQLRAALVHFLLGIGAHPTGRLAKICGQKKPPSRRFLQREGEGLECGLTADWL